MSNHSELRDLRSEGIHFENEYKFMILKSTMMPQRKEAFVGSQRKYKRYITISIRVPFRFIVYRHNIFKKLASLVCAYFINPLKPELNPICYLLALLGAHHFLHVSRIRVKLLTLR